jgi:hypothetical protein
MDDGLRGTVGRAAGVLVPFYLAVVAALAAGVWLGRRRGSSGPAVLGVAALAELVALATPHLDEPTSMALRRGRSAMALEAANLARSTHTRVAANNLLAGLPQFNLLDRVPDFRMTAALVPRRYFRYITLLNSDFFTFFVPRDMVSPLLEAAAVRYLIADEGRPPGPRVIWIAGRGLFRNDRALPRARLVRQVTVVPDEEAAQDWLREASSTKAHAADTPLGAQAVVEAASAGELGGLTGAGTGAAAGSVDFVTDQPDEVRLAVDTPAPALLVLADTHYPGWVATVDGRRAVIHPTNVLFRGVLVPAGRHDVRFRYRPLSLGLGLVLTALGAVGLGALLVVERRRRRLGVQERERERERSGPEGS